MSNFKFTWPRPALLKGPVAHLLALTTLSVSIAANAQQLTVPATRDTGTYSISWSGARTFARIQEKKNDGSFQYLNQSTISASPINVGPSGTISLTRGIGIYTYRLYDCLSGPTDTCTLVPGTKSINVGNVEPLPPPTPAKLVGAGYKLADKADLVFPETFLPGLSSGVTSDPFLKRQDNWDIKAAADHVERLSDGSPRGFLATAYGWVASEMMPEFRFGLSKGGTGAVLDRSGTPFDQAQLLKELLRVKGIQAKYVLGTAEYSADQFFAWTGVATAREACNLLSRGGIPGKINGISSADCASSAYESALSSASLVHIWITANIGGQEIELDPSFKKITYKSAHPDLKSALNQDASNLRSRLDAALISPASNNFQIGAGIIESKMDELAAKYLDQIAEIYESDDQRRLTSKDILGGREIDQKHRSNTIPTLPFQVRSRTQLDEIPDRMRLKVEFSGIGTTFADQIYGRNITFENPLTTYGCQMYADGVKQAAVGEGISLKIDFPYPAAQSTYMDFSDSFRFDCESAVTLTQGFGRTGDGMAEKFSDTTKEDRTLINLSAGNQAPSYQVRNSNRLASGNRSYHFLKENSDWHQFVSGYSDGHVELHAILGVSKSIKLKAHVSTETGALVARTEQEAGFLDIATRASWASRVTSNSISSNSMGRTLAWISSGLEGGTTKRLSGSKDSITSASRMKWAADKNIGFSYYHPHSASIAAPARGIYYNAPAPSFVHDEVIRFLNEEVTVYGPEILYPVGKHLVDNGFSLTWPQSAVLGPGDPLSLRNIEEFPTGPSSTGLKVVASIAMGTQLGGTLYAEKPSEGIYYPLVFAGKFGVKGGGAPQLSKQDLRGPTASDRQKFQHGYSGNGDASYVFDDLISSGPATDSSAQLSVSLKLSSHRSEPQYSYTGVSGGSAPFKHTPRFEIANLGEAAISSNNRFILGQRNALEAVPATVALLALLENSEDVTNRNHAHILNGLIVRWLESQTDDNAIAISSENGAKTFVRRVAPHGNAYFPELDSAESASINLQIANTLPSVNDFCGPAEYSWSSDPASIFASGSQKHITLDLERVLANGNIETYATRKINAGQCTNRVGDSNWYPQTKHTELSGATRSYQYSERARFKRLLGITNSFGREISLV